MNATITAHVTSSGGRALDGAVTTVMSQTGEQCAVVRSDAEGTVSVRELDSGTYTVVTTSDGYQPNARVAVVTGSGSVGLGEIALQRIGGAPVPRPGHWEIDAGHSAIEISVRHLGIATIRGRFTDFGGYLDVSENIERSSVVAEIKTASIDTDNSMRDQHLRSSAFFDVEQHPVAEFRAERVAPSSDDSWTLPGTVTLRGTAVPVTLELSYLGEVDDPWGQRRAGFRATGTLRRSDFGISFDDKLLTGVAQIGGTATVSLDIQAVHTAN